MAYVKAWSTKEEVMKDINRASGRRIRKKDDIDDGYLVIGDAPPPVVPEEEDDQMHILFGDAASRKALQTEDSTPDLRGIQQMLRMVQEFTADDDDEANTSDAAKPSDCVIAISKVSKLNPNVKEFIPKGVTSPRPTINDNKNVVIPSKRTINNNVLSGGINTNVVTQPIEVKNEDSSKKKDELKSNKDLDLDTKKANDYQDIATTLKKTISDAAKSDSFEFAKQKNVAIATLLRLYANNDTSNKSNKPVKLFTPEYFEGKVTIDNANIKDEVVTQPKPNILSPMSSTPEPKSSTTIPSSNNSIISTPLETSPTVKIDPEIKKSIDKVNKWLEEPPQRKSPAVCIGPITFKKKSVPVCESPASESGSKPSQGDSRQYKPSKHAADLAKQYIEKNKILESKKQAVTWLNLEEKLKEKDLVIKKRLEELSSASEIADDSSYNDIDESSSPR